MPITTRQARKALRYGTEEQKRAVLEELQELAGSDITSVLSWDDEGEISLRASADLAPGVRRTLKKVKVTPTTNGNQIEVEMHDKMSALRLLAKHHGLLDPGAEQNRPSVIGINMTGPSVTTYEVQDAKAAALVGDSDTRIEEGAADVGSGFEPPVRRESTDH
tara:strand:+ start:3310 stop:3798 length:489 start_codon:yes stop_codon:yes gene_type:complete